VSLSPFQSGPDCIINTSGYDFRKGQLNKSGAFLVPGFAKFVVIKKPATKERSGINPFTKEPTIFKAKSARKIVKARPERLLKTQYCSVAMVFGALFVQPILNDMERSDGQKSKATHKASGLDESACSGAKTVFEGQATGE
jgi:Bacterial DNA-binding protein